MSKLEAKAQSIFDHRHSDTDPYIDDEFGVEFDPHVDYEFSEDFEWEEPVDEKSDDSEDFEWEEPVDEKSDEATDFVDISEESVDEELIAFEDDESMAARGLRIRDEVSEEEPKQDRNFILPPVPGGDDQDDIIVEDDDIRVEEDSDIEIAELDEWDWKSKGLSNFVDWVHERLDNIPRHSGKDTAGVERVIAYLEAVDREISKAVRMDYKGEINVSKLEEARAQIDDGINRLNDRLDKLRRAKFHRYKKKPVRADYTNGIVKEATKTTNITGITITVPLFISRIARVCINGTVSAGHDIEDLFHKQAKKFDLTDREKAEVIQLIEDMGYPVRRDRMLGFDEEFDPRRSDNGDAPAIYMS